MMPYALRFDDERHFDWLRHLVYPRKYECVCECGMNVYECVCVRVLHVAQSP